MIEIINLKMIEFIILLGEHRDVVDRTIEYYSTQSTLYDTDCNGAAINYKLVSVQSYESRSFFQERGLDEPCISIVKKREMGDTLAHILYHLRKAGFTDRCRTDFTYTLCTHHCLVPRVTITALNVFSKYGKIQIMRMIRPTPNVQYLEYTAIINKSKAISDDYNISREKNINAVEYLVLIGSAGTLLKEAFQRYRERRNHNLTTYIVFSGESRALYETRNVFPKSICTLESNGSSIYEYIKFSKELVNNHNAVYTIFTDDINSIQTTLCALSVFSGTSASFYFYPVYTGQEYESEDLIFNTIKFLVKKHTPLVMND